MRSAMHDLKLNAGVRAPRTVRELRGDPTIDVERRRAERRPVLLGQCYKCHCYSPGTPMYSSASAMSHVPGELVGHVNRFRRSLFLTYFRLEQKAHQLYISTIRATGVKESN